jgi:hypothetical protein
LNIKRLNNIAKPTPSPTKKVLQLKIDLIIEDFEFNQGLRVKKTPAVGLSPNTKYINITTGNSSHT